jgi:putative endonuclease
MAWVVYILKCSDESFYTGITWNLKERIRKHNSGELKNYTRYRLPVRLAYWERFEDRFQAAKREKDIKGYSRVKKQKLIDSLH